MMRAIGERWWPAIAIMVAIFLLSSIPSQAMPQFPGWVDLAVKKSGHFLIYAILARAYLRGLGSERSGVKRYAWLLAVFYAATDELHQAFVPGRGASALDVAIDALGAAAGLWIR